MCTNCAFQSAPAHSAFPSSKSTRCFGCGVTKSDRAVRVLAEHHVQAVTSRMQAHRAIIKVVGLLIEACKGDDRPDCSILDELSLGLDRH